MNCEQASHYIKPFIEGNISHTELSDYLEHVEGCKECYEELDIMFIVSEGLDGLHTDEVSNFDFSGMLAKRIAQGYRYLRQVHIRRVCFISVETVAYTALALMVIRMLGIWLW